MFSRRTPQSVTRQCCCHRPSVAWLSTRRTKKKSSSSSSSSSTPPPPSVSLYDKLFGRRLPLPKAAPPVPRSPKPDHEKAPRPTRTVQRKEGARADDDREIDVSHVGDELRAWLKDAGAFAAAQVALKKPEPEPKLPAAKPVLVLSSMSRSLVASDFYRWAPQGRHVAGWAGGISKVVQALSPITREPRGQYFLFFDTWDAARRCRDQFRSAYRLTNKNESPGQPELSPQTDALIKQENENGESAGDKPPFPATPLELRAEPQIIPTTAFLSLIDSEPATSFRGIPTHSSTVPYRLSAHLAHSGSAPRHDLSWSVLVRLAGGKVTVDGMVHAIAADGAARNLPWRLVEPRPDLETWPRPVQALRSGSGRVGLVAERQDRSRLQTGSVQYGYTRFVVTLADAAEGRRFARAWHRREMLDEWTDGVMTVDATALW